MQICIWPSWCHCHSLSLASVNPDWFYLSGTGSHGSPGQRAIKLVSLLLFSRTSWVSEHQKGRIIPSRLSLQYILTLIIVWTSTVHLLQEDALLSDWMFLYIDICITTVIAVFSEYTCWSRVAHLISKHTLQGTIHCFISVLEMKQCIVPCSVCFVTSV